MGIVGPVESVGLTGVAGEARRCRAHDDVDLLLLLRKLVNRERDRRGRQLGDHVDAFDVVPALRNGAPEGARSASPESISLQVMRPDGFRACAYRRIPE